MLINMDFKQIEVVVLCHLSQSKTFIELLNKGTDIYKFFASIMYNKIESKITKEERDSLKIPILGISYGKGYIKLSKETGKSKEWCQDFIKNFYDTFPEVKLLHKNWIDEVNKTGQLRMFDGINFQFTKYSKTWSEDYNCWFKEGYSPTEIKNYPVQHTAYIVLSTFLTMFYRDKVLKNKHKYLLINTVHDSIMLDCRPEYVEDAKKDLQDTLDKLPQMLYTLYGQKFVVPIKAEITVGESWYEI